MYKYSIALHSLNEETYGIDNLELYDGVFGKKLCDFNGAETEDLRNLLIAQRQRIVLYTVNMPLTDKKAYVAFFRRAHLLNIENVKLSLSAVQNRENFDALREIIDLARGMGIRMLFEMEPDYPFFDFAAYKEVRSAATGLIFSPMSFLTQDLMPFLRVLYNCKVKDDIVFLRINDGLMHTGEPTPIEEGNAEVKECVSNLLARSFAGYFSITDYNGDIPDLLSRFAKMLSKL